MKIIIICWLFLFPIFLSAGNEKILIMTHAFNRPEFIQWQYKTFKKFLKDDYEFVVFNDASNQDISNRIETICAQFAIRSVRVPQHIHSPPYYLPRQPDCGGASAECAETIQYMLDTVGFDYPGLVALIDSDMFLIRDFSIKKYLGDHAIAARPQYRFGQNELITYFLPNLIFFNMEQLPDKRALNFNLGTIDATRVDTAGYTHYYVKKHPDLKWLYTNGFNYALDEKDTNIPPYVMHHLRFNEKILQLATKMNYDYEFYVDYSFLHFRAGSNWYGMNENKLAAKSQFLFSALEQLVAFE